METFNANRKSRSNQRGLAVIVVVVLLGILAILVASNLRTLQNLNEHLKLIEKKQLKRHEPSQQKGDKKKND